MKKLLTLALAALIAFSASGCGPKNQTGNMEDDESKPYEIIWYYVGASQKDSARIEKAVNKYLKDKINATVKLNSMDWGPYAEKMQNIMSSGEKYDIRYVNSSTYTSDVYKEAYIQLDDLMDKYAPKTKELLGEDFMNGARIDGKLYAVQANKDKAHHISICYRKDIADKYGFDMSGIKSIEDMFPIFDELKAKEPEMYGFVMDAVSTPLELEEFFYAGTDVAVMSEKEEGKVLNKYESEEYMNSAKLAHEMYKKGYIPKDMATLNNAYELKKQGRAFAYLTQSMVNTFEEMNAAEETKGSGYVYGEIPLTKPMINTTDTQGSMMVISNRCENPVRAMKFIELVNTDKYLNNLINFGIEGTDYTKISDNKIAPIPNSGYNTIGWQWVFGNTFLNYTIEGEDEDKFKKLDAYNKEATPSKYLGFSPNLESVKIEMTACSNVVSEYNPSICMGANDPEVAIPHMLEKLKQAGSEKVVAEVQKQYNEWKQKVKKND